MVRCINLTKLLCFPYFQNVLDQKPDGVHALKRVIEGEVLFMIFTGIFQLKQSLMNDILHINKKQKKSYMKVYLKRI